VNKSIEVATLVIGEKLEIIEIGLPLPSSWYQVPVTRHHIRPTTSILVVGLLVVVGVAIC
jgi:hypothetical protein